MSRSGRRRWYDAFSRLLGLEDVRDHQGQAIALLNEGKEWPFEIAFFPRDSLVVIVEEVLVSIDLQFDHVAPY